MKSIYYTLAFALILGNFTKVHSQVDATNTGTLYVSSGTTMYFGGAFTNKNTGSTECQGTIDADGHFTNESTATFTAGTGLVTLTGSSDQNLDSGGDSFYNLTINNTSTGVTLVNNDATATNVLTLTDGIVTTGSNVLISSSTTTGNLTGYSNTSFVNGNLRRHFTANTDTYVLPVGDGTATTNYKKADFINASLDLSGGTDFITASVSTVTESGCPVCDASISTSEDGTPIVEVQESAIWDITPSNSTVSSGTYGVNLYVANVSGLSAAEDDEFTVVKSNDGTTASTNYANWNTFDGTTTIPVAGAAGRVYNSGNGYAQKTGFSSFSEYAIGKSNNFILPVELLEFSAEWNNEEQTEAIVSWQTATEIDNQYFYVERSYDAINFTDIVRKDGAGNSTNVIDYSYLDRDPITTRTSYYRLRQQDFDGSVSYSHIEVLNPKDNLDFVALYPNPAQDNFDYFVYSPEDFKITIKVTDYLGKVVFIDEAFVQKGINGFNMDISHLSSASYIIQVISNSGVYSAYKRFVADQGGSN